MISGEEARRQLEQFRAPERGRLRDIGTRARLSADAGRVLGWLGHWGSHEDTGEMARIIDGLSERERLLR